MGGGEGKGRFRKAVAKTTLLRQMSSKVLPLTNPEARLASEDLRRKKQGSMRAQIKQRATGRVQVTDLYFSMLDMSWGTMLSYCVLAYVCTVALWACITLAAANDIDGSALSLSAKPFVRSLAFACENIVTMGWGQMEPRSGTAFAMGVLQHLTGLALNVLVFAIVCTKFQHPQSQLVFGDRACIVKRRGVPYLLIRLGNKRCNLIYHPDAKLSLLTPVSTPEGESYVRNESLEVSMPGVISGIYSIAHRIDKHSPLKPVLDDWEKNSARKNITVTFVGRDGVFHDDLHCIKRYSLSDDVVLDHRFVDATTFDEKTGKPKISFEKISDVVPLSKPRRSREFAATRAARLAKLHASLDKEPPQMKKPGLYLLYGALRRNEENPDQPLEQCCGFSAFAAACLRHANIPYSTILGDMHHKPKWFEKRWFAALPDSKSATYPAIIRVRDDGTSEFVGDSAAVVDAAVRWYPEAAARLASTEGALADGTAADSMMMTWFGVATTVPTCIEDHRDAEKRQAYADAKEKWRGCLRPLEAVLAKHAYLSGRDEPGRVDFKHYSFLRTGHDQFFSWLDGEFTKEIDESFPGVTDWRGRMAGHMRGAVSDADDVAEALLNLHCIDHYFQRLASLMPKRYRALIDELGKHVPREKRLEQLHAELDAEPAMGPGVHLIYGGLRRHDSNPDQPIEQCCAFSAFAAACLQHANIPYSTILGDMHRKPAWFEKRWFAALPESKSATYPAVVRVLEDGSSEFIGDSANVVDACCKWFPDAAAKLTSAEGALADGTAADGMMSSWFGVASTAPTCIEDHRDAEKRKAHAEAQDKWLDCLRPLEAVLAKHAYLSGRNEPGRVDFKHFSFLRLAHDQVFEAWLETAFAKEIDETFPRVTDWRARMAGYMKGAVSDAEDVTCALMNLHLTSHYFTKLAPLMPKRYQALIDSFAGGDEEEGDDDDDEEEASDSPPAGGTIQFCL